VRFLTSVLVSVAALGALAPPSEACGDKLLVIGRRVKRVPQAKHPAAVLLYMRPGSALPAAAKAMKLETTLRQAGHHVDTVDQLERLRGQLGAGRYDFVLTDLSDAAAVSRETASDPRAPGVVPVAYNVDKDALRASREAYPVVIQSGKGLSYLSALDSAKGQREGPGR
jgi:hypothetical protein